MLLLYYIFFALTSPFVKYERCPWAWPPSPNGKPGEGGQAQGQRQWWWASQGEKRSGFRWKEKTKLMKWCTPIADNQSSEKEGVKLRRLRDFWVKQWGRKRETKKLISREKLIWLRGLSWTRLIPVALPNATGITTTKRAKKTWTYAVLFSWASLT